MSVQPKPKQKPLEAGQTSVIRRGSSLHIEIRCRDEYEAMLFYDACVSNDKTLNLALGGERS